jgi:hypothetical protein
VWYRRRAGGCSLLSINQKEERIQRGDYKESVRLCGRMSKRYRSPYLKNDRSNMAFKSSNHDGMQSIAAANVRSKAPPLDSPRGSHIGSELRGCRSRVSINLAVPVLVTGSIQKRTQQMKVDYDA